MNRLFRTLSLGTAMVLGTFAFAQPAGPYDITVSGIVAGCNPNATSYVTITTQQGTQPELDIEVPLDANCSFFVTLPMDSYMGWFLVSTPCNGAIQSATVNYEYNVFQPDSNYVFVVLNCTGQQPADCLGIPGGPNTVGTACTDPATGTAGFWNSDCLCIPDTANTACEANFWVLQAYTTSNDGDTTTTVPVPNEVWVWNLTSGGEAPYTYLWSFGDGTSSVDPYPTHFYASGGSYQLCLTIADAAGCTSVHCDTITVDENGMYSGMVIDGRPGMLRNGFTLNVIAELPTAVAERNVVDEVALWPNPVEDVIGLAFTSNHSASLSLRIVDLNGREVRTSNSAVNAGNNRHSINVSDLEAGIYLLQISDGTHSTSRRFVKN